MLAPHILRANYNSMLSFNFFSKKFIYLFFLNRLLLFIDKSYFYFIFSRMRTSKSRLASFGKSASSKVFLKKFNASFLKYSLPAYRQIFFLYFFFLDSSLLIRVSLKSLL